MVTKWVACILIFPARPSGMDKHSFSPKTTRENMGYKPFRPMFWPDKWGGPEKRLALFAAIPYNGFAKHGKAHCGPGRKLKGAKLWQGSK